MTEFKQIKLMNQSMIIYLNSIEKNSQRNELIDRILEDEACFFKMDKSDAYMILEDIGIKKEKIDAIYTKLISSEYYYLLEKEGKINYNDEDLVIKYKNYSQNDLFKNEEKTVPPNTQLIVKEKVGIFQKIIRKIKSFFRIK